ncbi:hypothetical protein C0991_006901 [Blastosporella zonata]|nr:hypothetical protein C0991_006901 [Blastosporella zonata]
MNPKSPGQCHSLLDDDIEMNGLRNDHQEQGPRPVENDVGFHDDDHGDDSEEEDYDLLNSQEHYKGPRQIAVEVWPQVRNIVIEGNLEMNLSARLGTAANVGELDDPVLRRSMISGNLSLLQVQAAVVSFIAAWIALILGLMLPHATIEPVFGTESMSPRRPIALPKETYSTFSIPKLVMVASTGMTAAALSSIVLGSFMCALIVICRRYGRDPDNIAPPIAACLGDLVTLLFMGVVSSFLMPGISTPIPFVFAIVIVVVAVFCFISTVRNTHVRPLISKGWTPLFGAMIISSGTGIVLDIFASRYQGFALLAIVISGTSPGSMCCPSKMT